MGNTSWPAVDRRSNAQRRSDSDRRRAKWQAPAFMEWAARRDKHGKQEWRLRPAGWDRRPQPLIDRDERGRLRINNKEVAYAIFKNYSHFLDRLNKNVLFHDMMNRHPKNAKRFSNQYSARYEIYNYINDNIIQNRSIDYLEFGVFEGNSIKHWASINSHRDSRFFGFDTFEGLPEGHGDRLKGAFDAHGDIPEVDDERVTFEKGLFQDVLPIFLGDFQPKSQVVVHVDADLYSSTLYCLTTMNNILKPGSILIFDEFGDLEQEFAAFYDYTRSYYRNWELICAQHNLWLVAVQLQ